MQRYILRRFAIAIPMLVAISLVTFVVINLAPGDPVTAMINPQAQLREGDLERMREQLGLNRPIPVRYALWLGQLVRGNFGYGLHSGKPVLKLIGERVLATLELVGAALLIATVIGTLLGVLAALRQYSFWDYLLSILSLFGLSIPGFFFALVALYIFAAQFQVLPASGMSSVTGGFSLGDNLRHLILPAGVLSIELIATNTRYARTAMLEVLKSEYVRTARAKGLSELTVVGTHAFRNALLPLITITSLRLPWLLGGAVVIEFMFTWPGLGLLAIDAIGNRDYPTLMGLTFFIAVAVMASNLIADILYAFADPRIRV